MKHIAVFCDGTWNSTDAKAPTNVVKLAQAVALAPPEGPAQQVIYVPGVGTGRGSTAPARWLDRVAGGAFGLGLNLNLEEAYRALAFAHEPGDRIFLFGFSRGAYMARSLAGLLRASGLPSRRNVAGIRAAMARYRSRLSSTKPDTDESFAFRLRFAPEVTTGEKERAWRRDNGHPEGVPLHLAYLGVWDTVGALGVPASYRVLASLLNGPFQFHDTELSHLVKAARHAVAVDERRRTFAPALWTNLRKLNAEVAAEAPPYLQEWFPGDHGSVGGGGDVTVLSDRALHWIAEGAEAAGLRLLPGGLPAAPEPPADAPLRNRSAPPSLFDQLLALTATDRNGPEDPGDVAADSVRRWRGNPGWRPRTLDRVSQWLSAPPPG